MSKKDLQFRVSSYLKDIIGKDLITNKYIAVFELVKNSFDAHAEHVEIHIQDDQIVVKDDGKGMDLDDIKNKWLFVAYSAKADETEDESLAEDYRKKIRKRKAFAGAKGIGRFACDRLGREMRLISLKSAKGAKPESVTIEWDSFEKDSKTEFINIDVKQETLTTSPYPEMESGTVLEISGLREEWKESDVEQLQKHLAKLINPVRDEKSVDFSVTIIFKGERHEVENFLFDKLATMTTHITVETLNDGKEVATELIDRGEQIYKIREKNRWEKTLRDIKIELFYLNVPTKIAFTHLMKIESVNFGSIFLYKNGFRVFPFGERSDDSLGINRRKSQGYARYFGTRELIGFISVHSDADKFRETSSRDGGLIDSPEYRDLKEVFRSKALRRLEIYSIDTLEWTYKNKTKTEISPSKKRNEIVELIKKLTESEDFIAVEYSYGLPEKVEDKANQGFQRATERLLKVAKDSGDEKLLKAAKDIRYAEKRHKKELKQEKEQREAAEDRASAMMSLTSQDFRNLVSYHHQISASSLTIREYLETLFTEIKKGKPNLDRVEKFAERIKLENDKISSISRFATGSGMKERATRRRRSLPNFISSYIQKDYKSVASGGLRIGLENECEDDFILSFRPFDISTVLDNLFSNARKAGAKNINVSLVCSKASFDVVVADDGRGLDKRFRENPSEIFEPKVSTTNGAGWGLAHAKEVVEKMGGTIKAIPQKVGLKLVITFPNAD